MTYMRIHLHLHTRHRPSQIPDDPEPILNVSWAHSYRRLRQILILCIAASPILATRWPDRKRYITTHLDHYLSDWAYMARRRGPLCVQRPGPPNGLGPHDRVDFALLRECW